MESSSHPQVCPGDSNSWCANCHMYLAQPGSLLDLCPARGLWAVRCGFVLHLSQFLSAQSTDLDRCWELLKSFPRRQWFIGFNGNPFVFSLTFLQLPAPPNCVWVFIFLTNKQQLTSIFSGDWKIVVAEDGNASSDNDAQEDSRSFLNAWASPCWGVGQFPIP